MASRLVLVIGDLFIPDRAVVCLLPNSAGPVDMSDRLRKQFKKLLTPGKIGQILCLGNLTDRETYEYLRGLAPDLQLVKGDFDVDAPYPSSSSTSSSATPGASGPSSSTTTTSSSSSSSSIPLSKVITHGSLRIGFTHGHTIVPQGDADALLIAARQMDVDVLLWGGTHRFEAYELQGKFFVNPGSGTGAMSTGWGWGVGEKGEKSAKEMEIQEPVPSFCLMDVQGDVLVLYIYQLRTDSSGVEKVSVEKVSFRKQNPAAGAGAGAGAGTEAGGAAAAAVV